MAKDYDNYGYDDYGRSNTGLVRRVLIVVMLIVAIILILYLITSCSRKPTTTPGSNTLLVDYEGALLNAGKRYFELHNDQRPASPGECSIVELQKLSEEKLIDVNKFNNCNQNTTSSFKNP